jgi:hypothetical protein
VGLLDSFEKGLERAVNSAFAKSFRGIQPVEIAAALRTELDAKAAVVSRDRILAPNAFEVRMSPADAERMRSIGSTLDDELLGLVQKHAKNQGFSFAGPVTIALAPDDQQATGTLRVSRRPPPAPSRGGASSTSKARGIRSQGPHRDRTRQRRRHHDRGCRDEPPPRRDPVGRRARHGARHELDQRHAARRPPDHRGAPPPDSIITIGRTDITFRVVAQATPPRPTDGIRRHARLRDRRTSRANWPSCCCRSAS